MRRDTAIRTEAAQTHAAAVALKQIGRVNQTAELVSDPHPPHHRHPPEPPLWGCATSVFVRREESQLSKMMTKAELRRSQTQRHCRERMIRRY